jgi:hypothetical protein
MLQIYNCSWGPLPWAYVPEIFPTRIRALGLGVSMLAHWATSFCFSFASPYMIANIGANTFLVFMGFDILATVFCYFFVKETRGKNLEVAAGYEWEVAERRALKESEGESPEKGLGEKGILQVGENGELVDASGHTIEVTAVHDTFGSSLKH